jgi:SH3-like domain-containing protein
MLRIIIIIFSILFFESFSFAKDEYFLTLRYDKVNLRQGPSREYPVKIFYKKKFLPVLIQDQSDNFRKIRDHENNSGWIHISQLSKKKAAITVDDDLILFNNSTIYSNPVALIKKGRLVKINKCKDNWCKVKTGNFKGWLKKKIFGAYFN